MIGNFALVLVIWDEYGYELLLNDFKMVLEDDALILAELPTRIIT